MKTICPTKPTFAIRDGDLLQCTCYQNDLANRLWMTRVPHDVKNHFETKSSRNLIHSNSEILAKKALAQLCSVALVTLGMPLVLFAAEPKLPHQESVPFFWFSNDFREWDFLFIRRASNFKLKSKWFP